MLMNKSHFEYLHDGARSQHFFLHTGLGRRAADRGEVTHGVFGRHRLPGSGFATDDDRLILLISYKSTDSIN